MQSNLKQRILLTLAYSEQFNFPLTASELYTRLITNTVVSPDEFMRELKELVEKGLVQASDGFFCITSKKMTAEDTKAEEKLSFLITTRKKRRQYSQLKLQEVTQFLNFASFFPWITGVAITGSLAVNNATKDDDIDFMIVTAENRLWISRLLVIIYASIKGKRRSFAKEEKNSWCFNLWVEESDLMLPKISRSIYSAYEVVQSKWVLSRGGVASRFKIVNSWSKSVLVHGCVSTCTDIFSVRLDMIFPISQIFDILNWISYYLQYLYMKRHITREKVGKTHAFFHPRDTKSVVFSNWKKSVSKLEIFSKLQTS